MLIVLISGAHVVAVIGWLFSTIPVNCHWTYFPTGAEFEARCTRLKLGAILVPYSLFLNAFTVAVDVMVFYLSCRPVWRLQLAKRQKISILIILFAGVMYELAHPQSND